MIVSLHRLLKTNNDDSLAQLVEHIPFKDGVLSSNLRRVTQAHNLLKVMRFFVF